MVDVIGIMKIVIASTNINDNENDDRIENNVQQFEFMDVMKFQVLMKNMYLQCI